MKKTVTIILTAVLAAEMEAVKIHQNLAVEKARVTKKRRKQIPKNDRSKI